MCGVIGVVANTAVNQLLYDGLMVLQHRGQDAAGIVTAEGNRFHMHKGQGLARDVFRTRDMRNLLGDMGVAHVRYPTAGSASSSAESQPFYVNSPYGIVLGHNGNLTNTQELKESLFRTDLRHVNTNSDSEVLLNVLAHELQVRAEGRQLSLDTIFGAVAGVHARCRGAYAVVAFIAGYGLLAFRDPHGIRPLVIGVNEQVTPHEYIIASESVAIDTLGFRLLRDVAPGEAVFIDYQRTLHSRVCSDHAVLNPCIFEYVYLARPDSVMDGVSVYSTRLAMGVSLAEKIEREFAHLRIDVVIPIPDTSRPSALQLANRLDVPYREGFIKNRYIGRTFIMPGQALRKKSVRQKLNAIGEEFKGRNVLLVDDSIVRGTTSREIVQMARDAGAAQVYFASASPPVRFSNVYGIDMPTRNELIANGRSDEEIAREIGCDALIYQDLDAMVAAVRAGNPAILDFDTSCFDGRYITGDVTPEYLAYVEAVRNGETPPPSALSTQQLDLNLATGA
ncbi:amidophosphoribosyltransferase [Thiobacillus sedimenti]|uniref:Amidophosphoribosyltransferase n=1 Tax=Thiobacillus sedimenti TaxID=3110231 RepID=A0ABZ1CH63_9PROT|nr:amidophosphoribosyltransferase [Thiobacillus sp. SCUT-2]WRS38435.1 amidophosphoribosyltransferase [Thiobacillus sp. SCUT-2]